MKLSARNVIKGWAAAVVRSAPTASVTLEIGPGTVITASITNEAVDDLRLASGHTAVAVVKASDVMIGKE